MKNQTFSKQPIIVAESPTEILILSEKQYQERYLKSNKLDEHNSYENHYFDYASKIIIEDSLTSKSTEITEILSTINPSSHKTLILSPKTTERLRNINNLSESVPYPSKNIERKLNIRIPNSQRISEIFHKKVKFAIPLDDNETVDPYELSLTSSIPNLKYCVFCGGEFTTEIQYINTSKTFWASAAILSLGGVFGCFMIPYMMNSCKDKKFRCKRCKHYI